MMPRLLERTGTSDKGSITAFYTVLVEGDDVNEPISDAVRGILDGHIVLSRSLAEKNHYPAIDILGSVSRLMVDIDEKPHLDNAKKVRESLAYYSDAEDLINIGAYVKGSNTKIDYAVSKIDKIDKFLIQDIYEKSSFDEAKSELVNVFSDNIRKHK